MPKVSSQVREYSRFAETVGGDGPRAVVKLAFVFRKARIESPFERPIKCRYAPSSATGILRSVFLLLNPTPEFFMGVVNCLGEIIHLTAEISEFANTRKWVGRFRDCLGSYLPFAEWWRCVPANGETKHSTQKPVECMRRPILNNSSVGDSVYEPFLGSGTTLIAAASTDRICFGIEIDPVFVDLAIRRWQAFTGQRATRLRDGASFDDVAHQVSNVHTDSAIVLDQTEITK